MKKKVLALLVSAAMAAAVMAPAAFAGETEAATEGEVATASAQEDPFADLEAKGDYNIIVIVKGTSSDFWRAAMKGAEDEGERLGIKVTCQGPSDNTAIADQVQILNNAINSKPTGIALAASDANAVMDSLNTAKDAGIPLVCFNSGVANAPEGTVLATASTDNYLAGATAAEHLYDALKDKIASADAPVRIGVVNQDATSDSVINRGLGFIDKMCELVAADGKAAAVTGSDKYVSDAKDAGDESSADVVIEVRVPSQATSELCATEAAALLNEGDLIGIMGTNEETASGIITADENIGKLGSDVLGVGFDSSAALCNAVKNNVLLGAVTQTPVYQGKVAVDLLVAYANGDEIADMNTPAYWYDSSNMDSEEVAPNLITK